MMNGTFTVATKATMELVDITPQVTRLVKENHAECNGLLYLFNPHTTAGLTINEGADPDVRRDIIMGLQHIVPSKLGYRHREGNSPAHIMATLTGSSLVIHLEHGNLFLGTWQKIFFCEYDGPRHRSVHWRLLFAEH